MNLRRLILLCPLLLAACARSDPQAALDAAVKRLQTALESRDTSAVLELLHPGFEGRQPEDNREWAKRTMALLFLRYKNIHVIALTQSSEVDAQVPNRAFTDADVALTGAEGLIPDSARRYRVKLQWSLVDGEWKLIRLTWE
jgi:hypothetical protein